MSKLIIINASKKEDYNFEIRVKIDPSYEGSPENTWDSQRTVYLAKSGLRFSSIDWGDGSTDNSVLNHKYDTPGEYVIKAMVSGHEQRVDLGYCNIIEVVKFPGILETEAVSALPKHWIFTANKIPSNGLKPFLERLNELYPDNVEKLSMSFKAMGQLGHYHQEARAGRSRFYIRGDYNIPYLKATEQDILTKQRTQEELDLCYDLIGKGWKVQVSFDDGYRTTMPRYTSGILNDNEYGEITIGMEVFHVVFSQEGNILKGKLVRRNMRNGRYADEYYTRDSFRKIPPQEIYLRYQFKKPGEDRFGHDVWISGVQSDPKQLQEIELSPDVYPEGTVVRAIYEGKYVGVMSSDASGQNKLLSVSPFEINITYQ